MAKKSGKFRSAVSGRFVKAKYAASHPRTTIKETRGRKKK